MCCVVSMCCYYNKFAATNKTGVKEKSINDLSSFLKMCTSTNTVISLIAHKLH